MSRLTSVIPGASGWVSRSWDASSSHKISPPREHRVLRVSYPGPTPTERGRTAQRRCVGERMSGCHRTVGLRCGGLEVVVRDYLRIGFPTSRGQVPVRVHDLV